MGEDNQLLSFDWEDSTEDFFGITKTETKEEPKVEIKKEIEEPKEEKKTKDEVEEIEDEVEFFDLSDTKDLEDSEDSVKDVVTPAGSIYNDVYKDLKDTGIFKHVEIEDGEELDADKLFELQQEEYETEVSARLQTWATQDLDEDAKAFIKFKTQGGSTEEFFKTYQKSIDIPTGDIEDEDYQDNIIRYQLKEEGWDRDEIEDRLVYLTDQGRKQKVAERYEEKIKEKDSKNKQFLIKKAEQEKQNSKLQEEEFKSTIKDTLEENEEISGFKITKEDKSKLLNFLTKKEHKVSDTRSVTNFQKKLAETFQDPQKMVLLAKLLESDFDMSDFEKQVKTKTTRKVKSNLEQRKSLRPNNSGSSLEGSSLADLF